MSYPSTAQATQLAREMGPMETVGKVSAVLASQIQAELHVGVMPSPVHSSQIQQYLGHLDQLRILRPSPEETCASMPSLKLYASTFGWPFCLSYGTNLSNCPPLSSVATGGG